MVLTANNTTNELILYGKISELDNSILIEDTTKKNLKLVNAEDFNLENAVGVTGRFVNHVDNGIICMGIEIAKVLTTLENNSRIILQAQLQKKVKIRNSNSYIITFKIINDCVDKFEKIIIVGITTEDEGLRDKVMDLTIDKFYEITANPYVVDDKYKLINTDVMLEITNIIELV